MAATEDTPEIDGCPCCGCALTPGQKFCSSECAGHYQARKRVQKLVEGK